MKEKYKYMFGVVVVVSIMVLCVLALIHLEKEEKENAIEDGRNNVCYTQTGDKYYCDQEKLWLIKRL